MKRAVYFFCLVFLSVSMGGCLFSQKAKLAQDNSISVLALPLYSGPKARVVLADFNIKAAKASQEVGVGLREMLTNALINSNRFMVLARKPPAQEEQGSPTVLIIGVSVNEFEPQASGGKDGIGAGGGVGSGAFGGLLGAPTNKARISLEIHIVDAENLNVLTEGEAQGQASDVLGLSGIGLTAGGWNLGPALSGYANTPMEKAIRTCIIEAVRYISGAVPEKYYN